MELRLGERLLGREGDGWWMGEERDGFALVLMKGGTGEYLGGELRTWI